MPVLPELGLAAILAAVAYFLVLAILVVFVEKIPVRMFLGVVLVLTGLTIGLVALGEAGLGAVVVALLAALATDQSIETLGEA